MHENIQVWKEILNRKHYSDKMVILILNKYDIFQQKICQYGINLDVCFTNHKDWIPPKKQWNINDNYYPIISNSHSLIRNYMKLKKINVFIPDMIIVEIAKFYDFKNDFRFFNNEKSKKCIDKSIQFIKDVYLSYNNDKSRMIPIHITCATDKDNINNIFYCIQYDILTKNVIKSGFYPD